jgi:hypothetical protein
MNFYEWNHHTSLTEAKTLLLDLGVSDQVSSVRQRRFFYGLVRIMTGIDNNLKGTKVTRDRGIRILNILSKRVEEEEGRVRDRNVSSVVPKGHFRVEEEPAFYNYVYQTKSVWETKKEETVKLDEVKLKREMDKFNMNNFNYVGDKFMTEHRRTVVFTERDENEQYRTLLFWHNHKEYVPPKTVISPLSAAEHALDCLNGLFRRDGPDKFVMGEPIEELEPYYREQLALRKEYKEKCFSNPIDINLDMSTKNPKYWKKNVKKKFTKPIPFKVFDDRDRMFDPKKYRYLCYRENYEDYLQSQKEVQEKEEEIYQSCVVVSDSVTNKMIVPSLWHSKKWIYPAKTIKIDKMCADTIKEYMKRSDYRYMKYMKYNQTIKMVKKTADPLEHQSSTDRNSNSTGKTKLSSHGRRLRRARSGNDKLTPEEQDMLLDIHENWEEHETKAIQLLAEDASRTMSLLKHRKDYQQSLPSDTNFHKEELPSSLMVPSYMRKFVRDAISAITGDFDFQESRSKRSLAYHKVKSNFKAVFRSIQKQVGKEIDDYVLEYEQAGLHHIVDIIKKKVRGTLSEKEMSEIHASMLLPGHRKQLLAFLKKK